MVDDDPPHTAECVLCGGLDIPLEEDSYVILRGAFVHSLEHEVPIFVLDPDTKIRVIQLPNGQIALITDTFTGPTRYAERDCLHDAVESLGGTPLDPEDALRAEAFEHSYAEDFRRNMEDDDR